MAPGEETHVQNSRRRTFLKYTGATAATAALAGCASYSWTPYGRTGRGGGGGPRTPVQDLGEIDPKKYEGETFNLGILAPQQSISLGAATLQSAQMAADEINAGDWWLGEHLDMEGVLGAKLNVKYGNTQLQPAKTKQQFNRLTRQENCVATFGAAQMRPILNPMANVKRLYLGTINADPLPRMLTSKKVSPVGGDPEEEYEKYKYHFSPGPINTLALARNFIEFFKLYADDLGWDRIAFLNENGVEAENFMKFVPPRIREETDLELPIAKITSGSLTNWTPVFDQVESANCDAAIIVTLLTGTAAVNQWASQKRPFEMGGIHITSQLPGFWDDTSGKAEGIFTMNAVTPQTENTPMTQVYMDKYEEQFGDNSPDDGIPPYTGPITYDAVRILSKAIVETGAHPVDQVDSLIDYMESPEFVYLNGTIFPAFGFRPPTNRFAHDPIWDCMARGYCEGKLKDADPHGPTGVPVWQQWQSGPEGEGVMESIAPEANETAEYIKPPWLQ